MKVRELIVLYFLINVFSYNLFSQNFSSGANWKKYRKEVSFQLGASGFLGDLGGLNTSGTDFSPIDMEYSLARPALSVAYRYKLSKHINWQSSLNYLLVAGDDKLTKDIYRSNRNLNFKSNIFELSTRFEVAIFTQKVGHRYSLRNTKAKRSSNKFTEVTAFIGLGAFYFNPKGRNPITGKFENLYNLHTEGQGLPGGPKQYKRLSISIPMGIAWRSAISKYWTIGMEFCFRKTFSDYIDDVSTTYYDKSALLDAYGPKSVTMADPTLDIIPGGTGPNGDGTGAQRGDKEKDSFMALQVTVGRTFAPKRRRTKLRSKF